MDPVKIAIYVSGGVVQGVVSNHPNISVETFDVDDKQADGKSEEDINNDWETRILPNHPYHL